MGPKRSDALYPYFIWKMLVNPDLWTAFNDAKEALLAAIKTSLLPQPHLLSLDRADRHSAQTSIRETLGELNVFTAWLDETVNDLDGACKDIRLHRSHVQMSLSPIAILPAELVRYIVQLAVGAPENRRTILNVSHVSTPWREVVTSTSKLFTECDWNRWHVDLIAIWRKRAHEQPQKISLDDTIIEALVLYNTLHANHALRTVRYIGELRDELEQALLNCVHLHMLANDQTPWLGFGSSFHGWIMPRLQHLEMRTSMDGTFAVPENAPALQTLQISRWFPKFGGASLISSMTCAPGSERPWSEWAEMINSLPNLRYLCLKFGNEWFDEASPLHLSLLTTLELHRYHSRLGGFSETDMYDLINSFVAPNIKHFAVHLGEHDPENDWEGYDVMWDALVSLLYLFVYKAS